jgi:cell division protein FtsW
MVFGRLRRKIFESRSGEHEADKSLLTAMFALLIFGLVMLFSASWVVSYSRYGNTYHYFIRQFIWIVFSLGIFWVVSKIDYRVWKKFAVFFLFASIVLLLLVFVPGLRSDYGTARSWINIFGMSFQPSEFVKLSFLIYLATWLEAKKGDLGSFSGGIVPFLAILGVISILMILQPDLGTLFIIAFTSMIVFFSGGGKISHIFVVGLLAALLLFVVVSMKSNYQSDRFKCLENPNYSAQDKCYQINQSLIAVGSGGWFGRGIGESRQKFMYLPEVWADSIFPIIAEEIGFVFSTLLVLLYLFIFYRGLMIARDAPDLYGSTLAIGIIVWLAVQMFLNIGGMINLIPMTGVPLPFISSGGSAVLVNLISMGILINISKQTRFSRGRA